MANKKNEKDKNEVAELLRDLLIVELAKTGAPQAEIRKVIGVSINRVNGIAKFFTKKKDA
ncbi:MAG: hypothetical protein EPO61_10025 [Nitrospirae bacterium]|nr:MAG: hypothetical protein EPO61_10025 [Nitrospirota bacterium]